MQSVLVTTGRWAARAMALCLLVGAGLAIAAAPASAHGQLAMSTPVNGSTVSKPLDKLELYFTEQPASNAYFTITAPSGVRVDAGWTSGTPQRLDKPVQEYFMVDGKFEPRVYNIGFPALLTVSHWPEKGAYAATYLSIASDRESVKGSVKFSYDGAITPAPAGWVPPTNGPSDTLLQAIAGGEAAPGQSAPAGPTTPAGIDDADNTPTKPAEDGIELGAWILPGLLVIAVAAVVVHAVRKKPAAKPARGPKTAGRPTAKKATNSKKATAAKRR
jgi:methionine-rich copper-binding protein CopC